MTYTKTLLDYGVLHDTDKVAHAYLSHYEQRFRSLRQEPVSLLEIGVMHGASLRMWKDYFSLGQIYGVDVKKSSLVSEQRIRCFLGAQGDAAFMRQVVVETGPLDFVVDDGSHRGVDHVKSYEVLWPHVKPGGWYAIEDAFSLFDTCWTNPEDCTILDTIQGQWKGIIRSSSDVAEVAVVGCDTQKPEGRNNGLIFFRKARSCSLLL